MGDIIEEAGAVVQCRQCPWYKNCVMPMQIGNSEINQFKMMMQGGLLGDQSNPELEKVLEGVAAMGQNMMVQCCPVFTERLKSDPRLAERIKLFMQSWGQDDESAAGDKS
ncbi:MAG: hypothetical protein GX600_09815 [Dehalococcoidia bacterium]|jgi:hypothetical protein|nr:hypothetical protein [Dehalococcoidia bacterium]